MIAVKVEGLDGALAGGGEVVLRAAGGGQVGVLTAVLGHLRENQERFDKT